MSKRVPELGKTGAEIVGAAAQIGVHRGFLSKINLSLGD
jgi:hypothetical protein